MRYAIFNNKGGVGKTFLSFMISTEVAAKNPDVPVIVADLCPQANLSEIILGGNGRGAEILEHILSTADRRTIGGYLDKRIESPHAMTGDETSFLTRACEYNPQLPPNLWLIVGDPSLELQSQVINQIAAQTLPPTAWKNVHNWLKDLLLACSRKLSNDRTLSIIDCNPSFSSYTELAMVAAERLIVPCSSDGSSARAIDNIAALLYGLGSGPYGAVSFHAKARAHQMALPVIHSVVLNRSTQYDKKASKAFGAMFDEIKKRTNDIRKISPGDFVQSDELYHEIPDNRSVAIVCSHLGQPLYATQAGRYDIHDVKPQINPEPLDRYKQALDAFRATMTM